MKKILFAVFALAALASCTNNEVIELNQQAIAFGDVFVDNATRADYSQAGKLVGSFKVYGTANDVLIYNGNAVTRPDAVTSGGAYMDTAWLCDAATQYWVPNATYNFMAIVDGGESEVDEMPTTIDFTVADGVNNKDLLLATASVVVNNAGTKTGDLSTNSLVAFTFSPLLSKVQFTITENEPTGYTFDITSIKATGVQAKGTYTIGTTIENGVWAPVAGTPIALEFVNGPLQILPVEQTLEITLTYDIKFNGTKISSATKSATLNSYDFEANTAYNVTATLSLTDQIEFTVNEVDGWTTNSGDITLQ